MYNVLKVMLTMTINIGIHGHPLAHPRKEVTGLQPPPPQKELKKTHTL